MVASTPTHHHASPSPGSCAKVLLTASSSALSRASFWAWFSVEDIVSFSFPYTIVCREQCQTRGRLSRLNAHLCVIISSMARKYEMKRRAERQKETCRRIVDATVELHRTIGPLRTTISAIAEKAGVQRHTYYAHFPELKELYTACTGHYAAERPPPDRSSWTEVADHEERLRRALSEVYAYYGHHEEIFANVLRDAEVD